MLLVSRTDFLFLLGANASREGLKLEVADGIREVKLGVPIRKKKNRQVLRFTKQNVTGTAVYGTVRTVV